MDTSQLVDHVDIDTLTHLTPAQRRNVQTWMDLQTLLNGGDFGEAMDAFFPPEMTYGNPSRPDLGSYRSWKESPKELYARFLPSHYSVTDAVGKGDEEIWVYCKHVG